MKQSGKKRPELQKASTVEKVNDESTAPHKKNTPSKFKQQSKHGGTNTATSNQKKKKKLKQKQKRHGSPKDTKSFTSPKSKNKDSKLKKVTPEIKDGTPKEKQHETCSFTSPNKAKRLFEKDGSLSSSDRNKEMAEAMDIDKEEVELTTHASNSKAVLESYIHRINHISSKPNSILKMAITPKNVSSSNPLLAVSRSDGSIELLQLNNLFSLALVPGIPSSPMDSLICCSDKENNFRYFGASGHHHTFCSIDFETLHYNHVTSSGGGAILCMKAYLSSNNVVLLACGCEDGFIRIWDVTKSVKSNSTLPILLSKLPSAGNAILSLTWKKQRPSQNLTLFASVADATVRRYDYSKTKDCWQQTFRSTLDTFGSKDPTRVWAMQSLASKSTIITGDSYGQVQYWDDRTGLLQSTIQQNEEKVALYDIAFDEDEERVYAAGVDSNIICMEHAGGAWVHTTSKRIHTHDVNTLIVYENQLYSGGLDTKIGVCANLPHWVPFKLHQSYFYYQRKLHVSLAKGARMLSYHYVDDHNDSFMECFSLADRPRKKEALTLTIPSSVTVATQFDAFKQQSQNTKLKLQIPQNMASSALSNQGDLLVFCTISQMGLFYLHTTPDGAMTYIPLKVSPSIERVACASTVMQFLSCNEEDHHTRVLVCVTSGKISLLHIQLPSKPNAITIKEDILISVAQTIYLPSSDTSSLTVPIYTISISEDNKWLALLQQTLTLDNKLTSSIHIYQIKPSKLSHYWTLVPPQSDNTITTITLYNDTLLLSNTTFTLYMYDLLHKKLSDWNVDTGNNDHCLPKNLLDVAGSNGVEYPTTIIPIGNSKCIMASYNLFYIMDLDLKIPNKALIYPHAKYRKPTSQEERNFTICKRYNSMVFLSHLLKTEEENEMIVIELPWERILKQLCDPMERKEYGT